MDSAVSTIMTGVENLRIALQDVPGFRTVASAPYMFRPFIMLVFLGIAAGLVGVIVNLRCMEFNAEAMVHSVFPGIVAGALYWGIDNIVPGAAIVAVIVAIALTWLGRSRRINEAGTAIVLISFFGFGIVLSLYKGDMSGQLEALMFGRLLEVSDTRLVQSILVCLIALIAIGVSWRAQIFRAFDRDGAMAAGMNATAVDFLANAAIAAVVVASSSAVGILLVVGYLVVPGAAARLVTRRISTMVPVAILVGVAGGWFGMWLMTVDSPHPISPAGRRRPLRASHLRATPTRGVCDAEVWLLRAETRCESMNALTTLAAADLTSVSGWDILRLPLLEAILVGALGGLVGCLAVLHQRIFFTESVTHATFPGAVLGVVCAVPLVTGLGTVERHTVLSLCLFAGAAIMCIPMAWLMHQLARIPGQSSQAAAGIVLTLGFALGYFLVKWFQPLPLRIESFLTGSVLNVQAADVIAAAVILLIAIAITAAEG